MPRAKPTDEPEMNRLIGLRIRQLRLRRRLKLEEVAAAVGISYQQIQKYELGQSVLSATRLASLSKLFGVHVGYFFKEPIGLEKYRAPNPGLAHVMERLQLIERERPEALSAVQDLVRVLCNEIQGVRPIPRPHRRRKS